MSERADYYIEKVRYNKDRTRIVWVSVRQDSSKKLGSPKNMVRKTVLSMIQKGKLFMTIFRNDEGKYRKGHRVALVQVKGVDYLRTSSEEAEAEKDQLEDLPEY